MTAAAVQAHLDSLCKPPGSLGRLEFVAAELCRIQRTLAPETRPRRAVVFAADHGVIASGVSAWPAAVTALMLDAIRGGGAASAVLAREFSADLHVVDVGTLGGGSVRAGSRDLSRGPALTPGEFEAAMTVGAGEADAAAHAGARLVVGGEMGIGNTTPASCVTALLCGRDAGAVVGRGAGADDATLARKIRVVADAVARERPRLGADPLGAVAAVAGLEIAALAGFFTRAAELGLVIVLDGFVATAGLLIAERLTPGVAKLGRRGARRGRAGAPRRARPPRAEAATRRLGHAAGRGDRGAARPPPARRGRGRLLADGDARARRGGACGLTPGASSCTPC